MAQFAIKGHPTRCKEIIEILEMLGGENKYHINITEGNLLYTIREGDDAIIATYPNSSISQIYTLKEFLEKFPYKVGDKVSSKYLKNYKIVKMEWEDTNNRVIYKLQGMGWYNSDELEYYKEETMERKYNVEEYLEVWEETENGLEVVVNNNFELKEDNGKFYIIKKQPQYPKTYKECFNICFGNKHHIVQVLGLDGLGDNKDLFESFIKLYICRNAYWKIAGEQMGLGKSWEPDFGNDLLKYYISFHNNKIDKGVINYSNKILAFPTEEMRDTFYENFKDLIERCKELL